MLKGGEAAAVHVTPKGHTHRGLTSAADQPLIRVWLDYQSHYGSTVYSVLVLWSMEGPFGDELCVCV